ncbi:GntR family transcriptional regulator [Streptomyces longwoodensis]|uniref:GntR family transcriptional regulator n=1 Tax=Streptomyces longwoodensis TaxID=68231 RepID=UPI0033D6A163
MTRRSSSGQTPGARLEAELRAAIARGDLRAGDVVPTTAALAATHGVNPNTVSKVISRLKDAGILTGPAGGRTRVRVQPRQVTRSNDRYHEEKARVLLPTAERASYGVAEADTGQLVRELHEDIYHYEVVSGPADVREILGIAEDDRVLKRTYTRRHAAGAGVSMSISYLPYDLVSQNPDLLEARREPWPGGTMHQLYTVGVELGRIDDHISASMPTAEEQAQFDIPTGVPILRIRKISYDIDGRAVEVADIPLSAERTELIYRTPLERW